MAICSNCILTTDILFNCLFKPQGGNSNLIYAIPRCYIDSYTDNYTDNIIDDIVLDTVNNPGAGWYRIFARQDSVTTVEAPQLPNKFILQTLTFAISNFTDNTDKDAAAQEALDFAQQLVNISSGNGVVFAVQSRNGVWNLYGITNGMEIESGSKDSGAAKADVAGNTIVMTAAEDTYAPVLNSAYTFILA